MVTMMQNERSVVLPGIREMFPEHLLKDTSHTRSPGGPLHRGHSSYTLSQSTRLHTGAAYSPHAMSSRLPSPPGSITKDDHSSSCRPQMRCDSDHNSRSPVFSFDVLRSDPSNSSLEHIASSATFPNRGGTSTSFSHQPQVEMPAGSFFRISVSDHDTLARGGGQARLSRSSFITSLRNPEYASTVSSPHAGYSAGIISFPATSNHPTRARSPDDPDAASDGDLSGSHNGKKHVCPTCFKRFNRPSSLRIHVNTHTGATPFRCPWPDCAREFNVNSNMRRHYRNHTATGAPRPPAIDNRRRRKRASPRDLVFVPGDPRDESHPANSFSHPPIASQTMEDDSDGSDDGEDELDSSPDDVSPVYVTSKQPWQRGHAYDKDSYDSRFPSSRYSQSNVRSGQPGNSSPSPPLGTYTYSPSAPYSRSFADSKVSTALRPAFHSKPVSAPVPGEPMSV